MVDEAGKVLLLGDAGHTFCPSLGLGASVAIEDACAAGLILREGAKQGMGVEAMAGQVARLRLPTEGGGGGQAEPPACGAPGCKGGPGRGAAGRGGRLDVGR